MPRISVSHVGFRSKHALLTHNVQLHAKNSTNKVIAQVDSFSNTASILFPKAIHASLNPTLLHRPCFLPMVVDHTATALAHRLQRNMAAGAGSRAVRGGSKLGTVRRLGGGLGNLGKFRTLPLQLRRLAWGYHEFSRSKPYVCSTLTGGVVLTLSDFLAQRITMSCKNRALREGDEDGRMIYDYRRTLAMFTFGFFYYGIVAKSLYLLYDRVLGKGFAMGKAMFDSTVHTSVLLVPSFYMITGTVKGKSLGQSWQQLQDEYRDAVGFSILYWVPLMYFGFHHVPQESRILFITGFSLVHKAVLSWLSNRGNIKYAGAESEQAEGQDSTQAGAAAAQATAEREEEDAEMVGSIESIESIGRAMGSGMAPGMRRGYAIGGLPGAAM